MSRWDVQGDARWKPRVAKQVFAFLVAPFAIFIQPIFADTRSPCLRILLQLPMCFSRFLCLPLVCAVSVLHILCLWWLKFSSQWKSTHWVQGFVTSCFCVVFDSSAVVAEHGSGTESGGVTAT